MNIVEEIARDLRDRMEFEADFYRDLKSKECVV